MGSRNKPKDEHEVTLTLTIIQAVEPCRKEPRYYETTRNGRRKRVYESVKPLHNFHIEYQLMPGQLSPVYQTDVVTYSIVSKVFTDHDDRVINIWQENGLTYYGWKHTHHLKLSLESLLSLYNHTFTVRLWNTSNKLSPKARFDRPKAFRLPVPNKTQSSLNPQDSNGLIASGLKPEQLPSIFQDSIPAKRSRRASRRSSQAIESINDRRDIFEVSPRKTFNIALVIEEKEEEDEGEPSNNRTVAESKGRVTEEEHKEEEHKDTLSVSAPESGLRSVKKEMTASQVLSIENLSSSTSRIKGLTRRRLRQLQVEAEDTLRVEKEGLIVLSMKFADLFGSQDSINAKIKEAVNNVKDFSVCLSLDTPLMSERQRGLLNPTEFTIEQAINLPSHDNNEYKPAYVKYQFYDKPVIQTPAIQLSPSNPPYWNHTEIILLGTIESELLLEYLRGPPLAIEVHDRDQEPSEEVTKGALFGTIQSDPLIGTCAYNKEIQKASESVNSSYGIVSLDLSTFLDGILTMEYILPIINKTGQDSSRRSCDYTKQDSQLRVKIKLSCPLNNFTVINNNTIQSEPLRPLTPFGRIVFLLHNSTPELINRLLSIIKDINIIALSLDTLPEDSRIIALSTYKLTRDQMISSNCNVITGYHIEDDEKHVVVCEGLAHNGIRYLWDNMPHHTTQDCDIIKVYYNSDYTFSSRLYGNLDVDLVHIKLPHPLSLIIQQAPLYIRRNIPKLCFSCLMKMNELHHCSGFSDIIRSDSLPTPLMITALSLYCMQLQDNTIITEGMIVSLNGGDDRLTMVDSESKGALQLNKGVGTRRRRQLSWEPLDHNNNRYETILKERDSAPLKDHIKDNIVSVKLSSDEVISQRNIKSKSINKPHIRSYSEADTKGLVHLYSSQTYNSSVIGKDLLRRQLDPNTRYTYSQSYHFRTVEPRHQPEEMIDCQKIARQRFKYPPAKSNIECNAHSKQPPSSRIEELQEPFVDNLLHTGRLKPTVNWALFKWNERESDFERYRPSPLDFGIKQPVTIHLAGDSRYKEVKQYEDKEWKRWMGRVVVNDIKFHHLRRGIGTECTPRGPRASTQTDKLQGLLKDKPNRISYRLGEGRLRVDNLPSLSVIRNCTEDSAIVGYVPGPYGNNSLKQDHNTVPLYKPFHPPKTLHRNDIVLYSANTQLSSAQSNT